MASLNLQNLTKSRSFLKCFEVPPGHQLVAADVNALEPRVITYYSRDKNFLALYKEGAPRNDVYIFNAALMGDLGKCFRDEGYDPYNPDMDIINLCKKKYKFERGIAKVITLSGMYGAGALKMYESMKLQGVNVTLQQVKGYHAGFREMYSGVFNRFNTYLQRQCNENGGYILNGRGRPLAINPEKEHDIVNKFVQSTGHDILMKWIQLMQQVLTDRNLIAYPYIVDLHDESIYCVPDEHVEGVKEAFNDSLKQLNDLLGWDVPIVSTPDSGLTLDVIKLED